MRNYKIIGAGMAGLLAGRMLKPDQVMIFDKQESLPNNHHAVLRFRSSVVGDTLGIPFREVKCIRDVETLGNAIADNLSYSRKVTGTATLRSLSSVSSKPVTRYIAPPDFIQQMAKPFEEDELAFGLEAREALGLMPRSPTISTIPMPSLMDLLDYPSHLRPNFESRSGLVVKARLNGVDAHATLYVPSAKNLLSRISITGDELQAEYYASDGNYTALELYLNDEEDGNRALLSRALSKMGLDFSAVESSSWERMKYAKILPCDDNLRKRFILWASEEHDIFSLGRFATWRPKLLLDDLVNDIRIIRNLSSGKSSDTRYKQALNW